MKKRFVVGLLVALVAALVIPPAFGQATGTVKGACKDMEGKPYAGATVEFLSAETGRKYVLKTDKKGEYFSLGVSPGKYKVTLLQDGKEIYHFTNVTVAVDENTIDFDMRKEQATQAQGQGISPEELKKRQEAAEKEAKETNTVKTLNEKLASSRDAMHAGNYDQAIQTMTEATQMDPSRDILWANLADAYRASAPKQTDAAEKTKRFDSAVQSYQKAIETKQAAVQAGDKDPDANKKLASYYNNLADAQGKSGKSDDAIKSYTQAATLDPAGAGTYYFNLGAVLTNANKNDDAIQAFDKAIAADPTKADAYYWKGVNLVAKATTDKSGKVIAAPGTEEAFGKYLELTPTGSHAEEAKAMLQYIGSSIETSFGKQKKTASKPK